MATVNNRTIARTVTANDREIRISDTIFNSDTSAYTIQITWSDVVSITGTCNLHFVLGDGTTADRDSFYGVTITDNTIEFLLESALYSMPGLSCWIQFYDSNVYTPIKLVFTDIRIVPMGDTLEVPTTQPYPEWAAEIRDFDVDIGTVTTLDTGDPASASITGTFPSKILNLGLPKGEKGDVGEVGNILYGIATGINDYSLTFDPLPVLQAGLMINFLAQNENTLSGVTLSINGGTAISVYKKCNRGSA